MKEETHVHWAVQNAAQGAVVDTLGSLPDQGFLYRAVQQAVGQAVYWAVWESVRGSVRGPVRGGVREALQSALKEISLP